MVGRFLVQLTHVAGVDVHVRKGCVQVNMNSISNIYKISLLCKILIQKQFDHIVNLAFQENLIVLQVYYCKRTS